MRHKVRASRLEQRLLEAEQRAFLSWRENLSNEEIEAHFLRLCSRLAERGYLAPPPASLWSLPEEERERYLEAFTELEHSERWQEAALVVRELWLETIGTLQPEEQQGAAMDEDEELERERSIKLRHFQDWLESLSPEEYRAWAGGQERMLARQHEELSEKWRIWAEQLAPVSELPESRD